MNFAARLTRCPIAFDPAPGAEARALFTALPPELADLIDAAAGSSPYLAGLLARETEWIAGTLAGPPETALAGLLAALPECPPDRLDTDLRRAKRRVALLAGLADLGGVWTLEEVTSALTDFAELAVALSLSAHVGAEIRRGRLPGMDPEDAPTGAGLVALAMGKMGAGELNYSSDIDLICLYDQDRFAPEDRHEARAAHVRVVKRMAASLSDLTAEGYVFRTDLRLRPDPSVTPVCIGMEAAEHYYESVGRTWERAAYIKARAAAGDLAAGERFLTTLEPFVWRRHLDFAAIRDAHDMRLRIREHKGYHGPITVAGHNVKLGPGGIREIEFFTQTRQLIAGGRDPSLRVRGTVEGLERLADAGWIPPEVATELSGHYRALRESEHRLQMIADAQTHEIPAGPQDFDRFARLSGEADSQAFALKIRERLERVAALTEAFFAPGETRARPKLSEAAAALVDGWRALPALRSPRAVEVFKRVEPVILARLYQAANSGEALQQFDRFLGGLPAGVQLFSLFEANPPLIDLIVDICASAPALAAYLARNAGVLDAVIGGDFFAPWPGVPKLTATLGGVLAEEPDYELKLDAARRWAKEWHFRIGVHHLRGLIDAAEAGGQYAALAEATVAALWAPCQAEFARKHGAPPGRGAVVLGMGSLGAERLNAGSDLDLIVIYDPAGIEASEGKRPLASRAYYARLTQALVTALSAPMAEGRLYEVDMRLRPSGRQGPVATSLESFRAYQMEAAWTWEHLALTRARPVAGAGDLGAEVEAIRVSVLKAKSGGAQVLPDLAEMRERIFAARPAEGVWQAKWGPGRLQDVELLAQSFALRAGSPARRVEAQLQAGLRAGLLARAEAEALARGYRLLWNLQAGGRLLTETPVVVDTLGEGGRAFLLRETGMADLAELEARLAEETARMAAIVDSALALAAGQAKAADQAQQDPR